MATPVLGQHSATARTLDPYGTSKRSVEGKRVARSKDWVRGLWENLGPEPIYIKDKYHLKEVCQQIERKTGKKLIPKAFMKPASQGKGIEWNF
jgi:hypothetical protein